MFILAILIFLILFYWDKIRRAFGAVKLYKDNKQTIDKSLEVYDNYDQSKNTVEGSVNEVISSVENLIGNIGTIFKKPYTETNPQVSKASEYIQFQDVDQNIRSHMDFTDPEII